MRQLQLLTTAQLATMRDTTNRRNYSAAAEEFRREHQRHRVWGMEQRHARKLRSIYGHIPSGEELTAAWHDRSAQVSVPGTPEQAPSRPAVPSESTPSMPEQTVPEQVDPEQVDPEQVVPERAVPEQVEPEAAVAERVAGLGAAEGRPEHGVGAGGRATKSESALDEAVVAVASARRIHAATGCGKGAFGEDDAVRPGEQTLNNTIVLDSRRWPASWTTRFARSPPLRWRLPTDGRYRRFRGSRRRISPACPDFGKGDQAIRDDGRRGETFQVAGKTAR
jgi:hypothetical protein